MGLFEDCWWRNLTSERNFLNKIFSLALPDSLDLVTKWLQEAADDLAKLGRETLPPHSSDGATGGASAFTAIQNQAYLKLLKWDHVNRPFPEVGIWQKNWFYACSNPLFPGHSSRSCLDL